MSLHNLSPGDRELIDYAALLHDIGWHISREGHHKHSQYLILNGGLKNFTAEEIGIIANIANGRFAEDHPLATAIMPLIEDREALFLAMRCAAACWACGWARNLD